LSREIEIPDRSEERTTQQKHGNNCMRPAQDNILLSEVPRCIYKTVFIPGFFRCTHFGKDNQIGL
jgi:hypothetical protein